VKVQSIWEVCYNAERKHVRQFLEVVSGQGSFGERGWQFGSLNEA
jgi:hypothetical protein